MMTNPFLFIVCVVCAFGGLSAQTSGWQPSAGRTQIPIWPGAAAEAQPLSRPEIAATTLNDHLVAGRPWTYVSNVTRPTMTVYPPTGTNTGAAAAGSPGGGISVVAV